ncbi:hypothetical protein O9G_004846 [Rozella allomycis CSF55]|uniref:Uncharacterized protein n=1 Tax=Rozella allomycis (strain CSF55) TaxID=988480 RepID=A0A075B283_ROZAC|nr:hypothetical protein O9G_004846 [Rozella allomycis CSF55]|eukprot:EPZ36627.1 hypothetical protein O9G_004846 [Rozella allomycis CSF55]
MDQHSLLKSLDAFLNTENEKSNIWSQFLADYSNCKFGESLTGKVQELDARLKDCNFLDETCETRNLILELVESIKSIVDDKARVLEVAKEEETGVEIEENKGFDNGNDNCNSRDNQLEEIEHENQIEENNDYENNHVSVHENSIEKNEEKDHVSVHENSTENNEDNEESPENTIRHLKNTVEESKESCYMSFKSINNNSEKEDITVIPEMEPNEADKQARVFPKPEYTPELQQRTETLESRWRVKQGLKSVYTTQRPAFGKPLDKKPEVNRIPNSPLSIPLGLQLPSPIPPRQSNENESENFEDAQEIKERTMILSIASLAEPPELLKPEEMTRKFNYRFKGAAALKYSLNFTSNQAACIEFNGNSIYNINLKNAKKG